MNAGRDLDKTRDFTLGGGRGMTAKPGEDLYYNRTTGQYEMRNAVGGGRGAGRGGPTAEEMRRYQENRGPAARAAMADKADQDMMEQMGREYDKRMPSPEPGEAKPKRFAKGGVTRADGCVKKGHTRGKMV